MRRRHTLDYQYMICRHITEILQADIREAGTAMSYFQETEIRRRCTIQK